MVFLSRKLGDEIMESKSKIYFSESLIQLNQLSLAKQIIESQMLYSQKIRDKTVIYFYFIFLFFL